MSSSPHLLPPVPNAPGHCMSRALPLALASGCLFELETGVLDLTAAPKASVEQRHQCRGAVREAARAAFFWAGRAPFQVSFSPARQRNDVTRRTMAPL